MGTGFGRNALLFPSLDDSGHFRSFPVVARYGGVEPGQERAKWRSADEDHRRTDLLQIQAGDRRKVRRRDPKRRRPSFGAESNEALEREIDQLFSAYADALARSASNGAAGAIYARYSSRYQQSIGDQVRTLLDLALAKGIRVPREHIHYDTAVSGRKSRREGLGKLLKLLEAGKIRTLLVFATNRLFRKTYKSLQFVEEELVERGIRCIFWASSIDTADSERWRLLLQAYAMIDEFVIAAYTANIRAAHIGLMERGIVFGAIPYGYTGEPIPGELTKRGGSRKRIIPDPSEAEVVRLVFGWYTDENIGLAEIVRRLNGTPEFPRRHRSDSRYWTDTIVRQLLRNRRYQGDWAYGTCQNVWLSKKDYARAVPREKPLAEAHFEKLRIVSDELWHRAQERLAREAKRKPGRRPKDGNRAGKPRILNGLLFCAAHDCILRVAGPDGTLMACPTCQRFPYDTRPLVSMLTRKTALRLTCERLAAMICSDRGLVAEVIDGCRKAAASAGRPDPSRLAALKSRDEALTKRIRFILDTQGGTDRDVAEAREALQRVRVERTSVAAEIAALTAPARTVHIPTEAEVTELLDGLAGHLGGAGQREEDAEAVHEIIRLLTGGRIDVVQAGERRKGRGWLQGRFRVDLLGHVVSKVGGAPPPEPQGAADVVIDFREPPPYQRLADRAKELYDRDVLICDIAAQLQVSEDTAGAALRCWFESRGMPMPDARARRHRCAAVSKLPPLAGSGKSDETERRGGSKTPAA